MNDQDERCWCGQPLHYTDPAIASYMRQLVRRLGAMVRVEVDGRVWLVPRHYIALHGLRAEDVPTLGFEDVTGCHDE